MKTLKPGEITHIQLTKKHHLLLWNTPVVEKDRIVGGALNQVIADRRGLHELLQLMQQQAGFQFVNLDQPGVTQLIKQWVLYIQQQPPGSTGQELPADIRYWLEDLRERWESISDYHKSMYFCALVFLGRDLPLPPEAPPGVDDAILGTIQALREHKLLNGPDK